MNFSVDESPAAKALGPLFKLTEVHLRDEVAESSYVQESFKLVSNDKDCERDDYWRTNGFCSVPEDVDVELAKQMNDLGLPLSFQTNKETRYGTTSGKGKGSIKSNQQSPIEIEYYMPDSTKGSEEESRTPARVLNTSEMLDQSDKLKNETVAEIGCLADLSLEQGDSLISDACASTLSNEHEYNREASKLSFDACVGCISGLLKMVANGLGLDCGTSEGNCLRNKVADCDWNEINGQSNSLHQEASLVQMVHGLAKESTNDAHSLGQHLEEISGDWVSTDDVSSTNTRNKKKKAKSKRKLSISSKGSSDKLPSSIKKYWRQRYLLFSRFDSGIKMDEEGWFSVTPETLAKHHAERCGRGAIVDFFTGVGGNAIQFAQRSRHVIAIDIDPIKIDYARHNAALYGVDDIIDFIKGDSFSLAPKLKADTVFCSPPWGGPDYSKVTKFDINYMLKPRDGKSVFDAVKRIAPKIVMFLPKNVDINQLAELSLSALPPWSLEVEKNYLNGRLKAVTAYFCDPYSSL